MKKVTILLSCMVFLMCACSNEEETPIIEPLSELAIDYYLKGERITVDFREDASGNIVPIPSEGLTRMEQISAQNPELIYNPVSKNEVQLYANEEELYSTLNITKWGSDNGQEQLLVSESSSSSTFLSEAVQRLTLYNDAYFINPLLKLTDPCFPGTNSGNPDFWIQRRLQNFNDPSAYNCNGNNIVYNDRVSSMIVAANSQRYAFRFFVDKNFGASSLWLYGSAAENFHNNLSNNTYSFLDLRNWNNKISSAKVIDLVLGQELNGAVSTGGGGGSNTGDPGDNGQGNGDLGGVPVIVNF